LRLYAGILEQVCSNGLIVETGRVEQVRIPHLGFAAWMVESAVKHLADQLPRAFEQRERWRQLWLKQDEVLAFADAAASVRFDRDKWLVIPQDLLQARRRAKEEPTLWNTLNVVQESTMRAFGKNKHFKGVRTSNKLNNN
jgi:hypothetical protein